MRTIYELCDIIRETAYAIHTFHGHGHLEKVYENALAHRLRKLGLDVQRQHPITVFDEDGTVIGEYFADLLVDQRLVVEIKAASSIAREHVAQTIGYLKSSRTEHGLLINFGSYKFQIKKLVMTDKTRTQLLPRSATLALFAIFASLCGQFLHGGWPQKNTENARNWSAQ